MNSNETGVQCNCILRNTWRTDCVLAAFYVRKATIFRRPTDTDVGGQGGRVPPPPLDSEKIGEKREKIGENPGGKTRKGKNREGSFTLPLPTDRAVYATA